MNLTPYNLHAVIVHDGSAQSGHYFAFIFDWHQKVWRKYNDIRITEVTEEEVFRDSNGGFGQSTGYWVVYIDQQTKQELENANINNYDSNSNEQVDQNHIYASKVTGRVNMIVVEDNMKLKNQITEY